MIRTDTELDTYAKQQAILRCQYLAKEILRLLQLPNWDAHHFHTATLKAEFKELIKEHELTPEEILAEHV